MLVVSAFVLPVATLLPGEQPAKGRKPVVPTEAALAIHREALDFDGHTDLPWQFREQGGLSFEVIDLRKPQKGAAHRHPEATQRERLRAKGKIASLVGIEGGHSIDDSLRLLR